MFGMCMAGSAALFEDAGTSGLSGAWGSRRQGVHEELEKRSWLLGCVPVSPEFEDIVLLAVVVQTWFQGTILSNSTSHAAGLLTSQQYCCCS
jgi:hypothetical protein